MTSTLPVSTLFDRSNSDCVRSASLSTIATCRASNSPTAESLRLLGKRSNNGRAQLGFQLENLSVYRR